jgi:hypothetical protein
MTIDNCFLLKLEAFLHGKSEGNGSSEFDKQGSGKKLISFPFKVSQGIN